MGSSQSLVVGRVVARKPNHLADACVVQVNLACYCSWFSEVDVSNLHPLNCSEMKLSDIDNTALPTRRYFSRFWVGLRLTYQSSFSIWLCWLGAFGCLLSASIDLLHLLFLPATEASRSPAILENKLLCFHLCSA